MFKLRLPALVLMLAVISLPTPGFETDQYNLPPEPLADLGGEVSEYVAGRLYAAAALVNGEIARAERCIQNRTAECGPAESETKKLVLLRSDAAIAGRVFDQLGKGSIFRSGFGRWMESHKFRGQPDRYKAPYSESIFVLKPSVYATLSPTIRLYGVEFGIDKLDHFFQQGHDYLEKKANGIAKGKTESEAVRSAIEWGRMTERTYYGLIASGVYSNADLFANYAGLLFYEGLTRPTVIAGKPRPAILELKDGLWQLNTTQLPENLLKPFISNHLNEALNPSAFRVTLVRSVRREVKKHACPKWKKAYPMPAKDSLAATTASLETWFGVDYGHTKRSRMVSIADVCFDTGRSE